MLNNYFFEVTIIKLYISITKGTDCLFDLQTFFYALIFWFPGALVGYQGPWLAPMGLGRLLAPLLRYHTLFFGSSKIGREFRK